MLPRLLKTFRNVLFLPTRSLSRQDLDPLLLQKLTEKIEDNKVYKDFSHLLVDNRVEEQINRIITIYDGMKYDLENVPTALQARDIESMLEIKSVKNIKKVITKLYRKELDKLLMAEIRKLYPVETKPLDNRSGLFDENGDLVYGLWHNSMFTRISHWKRRYLCDQYRYMETFGQKLYIDFSFSQHVTYNSSLFVSNDIANLINYNRHKLIEPFKIILCGVNYTDNLWKVFSANFPDLVDSTQHTSATYIELVPDQSQIAYYTCMEKEHFLENNPDFSYVIAAVAEKDIGKDFLSPRLKKLNVKRYGIPVDEHIVWNTGSKRFSATLKFKILNDICNGKNWKDTLLDNLHTRNIKTIEQVLSEDKIRHRKKKTTTKVI